MILMMVGGNGDRDELKDAPEVITVHCREMSGGAPLCITSVGLPCLRYDYKILHSCTITRYICMTYPQIDRVVVMCGAGEGNTVNL